jgi:flagellar motor switch protein FliG
LTNEEAAMVLPELRPRELERLTAEPVRLRNIDVAVVDDVLNEFHGLIRAGRAYGSGGEDFARDVLAARPWALTRPRTFWPA